MQNTLPSDWEILKVGAICSQLRGITYQKEDAYGSWFDDSVLVLRGGNIQNGRIVTNKGDDVYVKKELVKQEQLIRHGDVIIVSSTGSKALIGKAAHATGNMYGVSFGAFLTMLRPKETVDKLYFNYYFQTNYYRESIRNASGGININNIRREHINELDFPLPPLNEQKRIGKRLDQIFQHLFKIEEKVSHIKDLHSRAIDRCLINPVNENFYPRRPLSEFLEERTKSIGENWRGKRKVGVSAQKGIIDLDTGQKTSFERYKVVSPGDFVYNTMRVNIGSIAIYEGDEIAITSPDYIVFRPKSELSAKLLLGFLKSPLGLMEISANTKGSVRSRLYFKSLGEIKYPIAPLEIQRQAENLLSWFATTIASMDSTLDSLLESLQSLLLDKAYKGEL